MRRFMGIGVLLALGLPLLAGCGVAETATTISNSATQVAQTLSRATIDQLAGQLPSIEEAIAAGNTEEARAAFNQFLATWDTIKEAVKAVAPDAAAQIQQAMDSVKKALIDTPMPSAAEVQAALDELERQLTSLGGTLR